jgi:hypothetical protein
MAANDRESPSGHLGTGCRTAEKDDREQRDDQESVPDALIALVGRVVDGAHAWIGGALRPRRIAAGRSIRSTVSVKDVGALRRSALRPEGSRPHDGLETAPRTICLRESSLPLRR